MRCRTLLLAGLALAGAAAVLSGLPPVRGDLIVFKDGFLIQGQIKQDKVFFVDPITGKGFTTAKLDGFYMVDDEARRIVFSASQVIDAVKQEFINAADRITRERITRLYGGQPLDPVWQVDSVEPFKANWERLIKLNTAQRGVVTFRQRITMLTPHFLRLETPTYRWDAFYLTREFSADTLRTLLYDYFDWKANKGKVPEPEKRLRVFRFLLQAGYYDEAEKELDGVKTDLSGYKQRLDESREVLRKLKAVRLVDDIERAHKAGQPRRTEVLLAQFQDRKIGADLIGEDRLARVEAIAHKNRAAEEDVKRARKFLQALPARVEDSDQRRVFAEAAEVIAAHLNADTVARVAGFIGQAAQEERDRARGKQPGQTPAELLGLAVSGWLQGNDAAEAQVDQALKLWDARAFVLKYQTAATGPERARLLEAFGQAASHVGPDELAQMLRFLPPAQPEKLPRGAANAMRPLILGGGKGGPAYQVQLPPEYHPHRAYPVLLVLHGSNEPPLAMLKRCAELAAEHGYILAAPEWSRGVGGEYRYSAAEHGVVLDTLRDLRRRFQVDSDRVFLFGYEEGGNMAYDVSLSHPDQFAGVLAMAARPKFFAFHYWPNAQYLPFYVVDGSADGQGPKSNRDQFKECVRCHYPALFVEYKGRGPEWFDAELPAMFEWMGSKRRANPLRELGRESTGYSSFSTQEFKTMRETDNRFYWLSTSAIKESCLNDAGHWKKAPQMASLAGHVGPGNSVYVHARGVKQVSVWFPPALVDFEKPVTIRINGGPTSWTNKVVTPSMAVLLEDFYERGDRQRVFLARKDFTLR